MTNQVPVFKVGDAVTVLNPWNMQPKVNGPVGGIIHKITFQSTDGEPLYWVVGFATARTARVLRLSVAPESTVRYEVTVTIERPVRYDRDAPMSEQEEWRVSREAKRDVEREVLKALRTVDGTCDCEVMAAKVVYPHAS